jgi:hypothetical protein
VGIVRDLYNRFQEPAPQRNPLHEAARQQVITVIHEAMINEIFTEADYIQLLSTARAYARQYNLQEPIETWLTQGRILDITDCTQLKNWADTCPWPLPIEGEATQRPSPDPYQKYRL